ncbi:HNH endonuclease [Bacillus cereus]|nr:HNH endonuclease [Bacillus cereus]
MVEIAPETLDNRDITLNHENLQYLCLSCHHKKTFSKSVLIG